MYADDTLVINYQNVWYLRKLSYGTKERIVICKAETNQCTEWASIYRSLKFDIAELIRLLHEIH